jgi:hypothetical protein
VKVHVRDYAFLSSGKESAKLLNHCCPVYILRLTDYRLMWPYVCSPSPKALCILCPLSFMVATSHGKHTYESELSTGSLGEKKHAFHYKNKKKGIELPATTPNSPLFLVFTPPWGIAHTAG